MILLVSTGGTISGRVQDEGTYSAALSGADLLRTVQSAVGNLDIQTVEFTRALSFEISLEQWLELIRRLRRWNDDPSVSGIVISQGTALLEEVPFLASLFVKPRKPIVFTGAMVPASVPGSDAQRNLLDALRVASDPTSAAYGVLVCMDGRIVTADRVVKRHKSHYGSVTSLPPGPAGEIDPSGIHWLLPPLRRAPVFQEVAVEANVPLFKVALGMSRAFLDAVFDLKPPGIVIEGFPGGGGLPVDIVERVAEELERIPVVLASRSPEGRMIAVSGGRSGGGRLLQMGAIPAGELTAVRARLLLMAALGSVSAGEPPAQVIQKVRDAFRTFQTSNPLPQEG